MDQRHAFGLQTAVTDSVFRFWVGATVGNGILQENVVLRDFIVFLQISGNSSSK